MCMVADASDAGHDDGCMPMDDDPPQQDAASGPDVNAAAKHDAADDKQAHADSPAGPVKNPAVAALQHSEAAEEVRGFQHIRNTLGRYDSSRGQLVHVCFHDLSIEVTSSLVPAPLGCAVAACMNGASCTVM